MVSIMPLVSQVFPVCKRFHGVQSVWCRSHLRCPWHSLCVKVPWCLRYPGVHHVLLVCQGSLVYGGSLVSITSQVFPVCERFPGVHGVWFHHILGVPGNPYVSKVSWCLRFPGFHHVLGTQVCERFLGD